MEFNKLVFAGLSIGCLAAAAGGSYLAVRQNQTSGALSTTGATGAVAEPAAATKPDAPVTESEGVIAPEGVRPADPVRQAPAVSSKPANSRLAGASTRRPSTPFDARDAGLVSRSGQTPESPAPPAAPTASGGTMWESRPSVQPSVPELVEPEATPPPLVLEFVDVTVPSDAVLGLQIERTVSSELARVEDKVDARVTRDVRVDNRIAIPAGSTVRGSVIEVDKGGRVKGKARLAIRFHTIVLADGTQLTLKSDPVVREGQSPAGQSAAKVGGAAIGGAILGAILGGGKGAATGAAVGAGAGTAAAMSNDRNPATLSAGTTVTVRMQAPVTVTVQKE